MHTWPFCRVGLGIVASDSVASTMVTFDATGVVPGTYTVTLQVETNETQAGSFRIPVTMRVVAGPVYLPTILRP